MASTYLTKSVSKLSLKEIRAGVASLAKTANQRLRQLESSGVADKSSAYSWVNRQYGDKNRGAAIDYLGTTAKIVNGQLLELPKFSTNTRGRSADSLRNEFQKLQDFLNASTSTVKGYKESMNKSYEAYKQYFEKKYGRTISREDWEKYWGEDSLWKKYRDAYGYNAMQDLMRTADENGINATDAEMILRSAGFSEDSGWGSVEIRDIERAFRNWNGQARNERLELPDEV